MLWSRTKFASHRSRRREPRRSRRGRARLWTITNTGGFGGLPCVPVSPADELRIVQGRLGWTDFVGERWMGMKGDEYRGGAAPSTGKSIDLEGESRRDGADAEIGYPFIYR